MHPQGATGFEQGIAGLGLGVFQVGEDRRAAFVEAPPGIGHRQAPRGALQQAGVEHLFQCGDGTGDVADRGVEVVGHGGEAAHFNDLHIHRHVRQLVHFLLPECEIAPIRKRYFLWAQH